MPRSSAGGGGAAARGEAAAGEHDLGLFIRGLVEAGLTDGADAPIRDEKPLYIPHVHWDRLSGAVFDRAGAPLASVGDFPAGTMDELKALGAELPGAGAGGVDLLSLPSRGGGRQLVALASRHSATSWILPEALRQVARTDEAAFVALSANLVRSREAILDACGALGLTGLQGRLTAGLVRTGDLRAAAEAAGVTYNTAREAISLAMRRVGVARQSGLVEIAVQLAFGVLPHGRDREALLRDAWGLTTRQAGLAAAVAQGASRAEAARGLGLSDAVAKKELGNVFLTLGVTSATELAVTLSEAIALATLVEATAGGVALAADSLEPLKLIARPGGGVIAASAYGPSGATPVLILHSSSSSRPAPSVLVGELQARGFRPFAIDRPGFGLSDPAPDRGDPFAVACEDIRIVCAHFGFQRIDVVGRGGAHVALNLASQTPALVGRVVLVAPDPPTRPGGGGSPLLSRVKTAFSADRSFIAPLARLFVANLSVEMVRDAILRQTGGVGPDAEVMRDPKVFGDYFRGIQMFLAGRLDGYVREQAAMVAPSTPAIADTSLWRVLIGAHDFLHDPAEVARYWRERAPQAQVDVVSDGGRFLAMSHAGLVAETLSRAAQP